MKICMRPVALGLIAAFGQASALLAEETLTPIVVTAARAPLLLEHATGETIVITDREIEARQPVRLTDILDNTPGLFVATGKGMLQPGPGLAMRGMPSDRRSLLLVDGIAMTDGYSGSVLLGGIPPESVKQAEILFGPMSSLYGGNAMGGVINFVTRMPKGPEFGITIGYGDAVDPGKAPANVRKTFIHAGTLLDNGLSFRITANRASTDGYRSEWVTGNRPAGSRGGVPTTTELGAPTVLLGQKGDNTWEEQGASVKVEQHLGGSTRWRAGWLLQEYGYAYERPTTYLRANATGAPAYTSAFAGGDSDYRRQIVHAGYESGLGVGHLNLLFSHSAVKTNSFIIATTGATAFGGPGRLNDSPSDSSSFDSYWNAALGSHDLTVGYAFRQDRADARDYTLSNWADADSRTGLYSRAKGKMNLNAAYVQDNWLLAPSLTVQTGLRYDHWENADGLSTDPSGRYAHENRRESAWSPKIGASLRLSERLTLRTSAGQAFHAPTVYDLYRSSSLSTYNISANPALKPETVTTWEFGADWQPWTGGEIRSTYFHNEITDLIYLGPRQPGPGGKDVRLRINAGKAESSGVTFAITHRFDADNRVFANLTYTDSEMLENRASPNSVGKQLTNLPRQQASIGFASRRGAWQLAASGRYAAKQFSDDSNADEATGVYKAYDAYFVVDARLAYRFSRQLTASLAVSNLFDRDYFSYYAAPGRAWFASLSYNH